VSLPTSPFLLQPRVVKITAKRSDTNEYFDTVSRLPPGGSLGTPKIDETC